MTEPAHSQGPAAARHFRRLYLIALSAIAALAIGGQILVQYSLTSQRGDGHVVNRAGYQRMLSQRITLKLVLFEPGAPDAPAQLAALVAMRDRWRAAHADLASQVGHVAYGETARATLDGLFAEAAQPLGRIAALVDRLETDGRLAPADRTALLADQELFLPLMDAAVLGFERSVEARVTFLQRVEFTLLLITLGVLALEAVLIFRPAVARLQASLEALEYRNRQATRRLESLRHLAGGIAHSFNNLLTGILGHAELERLDALHHQRNTEYLDAQIKACRRAAEIIAHLVTYSGHGHYECRPTALGPWLDDLTRAFPLGRPDLRIAFRLGEDAQVAIDHAALKQALEGILVNAVEAMMDRAGVIQVSLGQLMLTEPRLMSGPYRTELPAGLYARIEVADQGKGIATDDLERIFDPYYTRKEFGRGLGLAAVLGIVHGHGGGITVTSTPGHGATVTLLLPLSGQDTGETVRPRVKVLRRPGR